MIDDCKNIAIFAHPADGGDMVPSVIDNQTFNLRIVK